MEGQGQIRSRTFIHRYLWNLSMMSSCYSDFRYLDWFWSYGRKTGTPMTEFSVFFYPPAPTDKNSKFCSIESECSRFRRFRENLVEICLVDSEKLG